jgi:energy-converting hydrogenase Eha subunit A
MAITTLDGAIAGMQAPAPLIKVGVTMAAVGAMRGYTPWYVAGNPGAATANAAGVNGAAVSATVAGQIPRTNPVSGNAHLARFAMQASTAGTMWLIDRLWNNSGLSVTSTTAQAITPATLPSRDGAGGTNGANVMAAIEWSAAGGAGTPTVTLTYTDQDGNTGATGTFTGVASPPLGTFEIFTLAAGDTGVRAPTSFIQSATRTSGTMHLVLFRVLAQVDVTAANIGNAIDALTAGMPRIYNDSVLQLVWFPSATTATNFIGQYIETQG